MNFDLQILKNPHFNTNSMQMCSKILLILNLQSSSGIL